MPVYTSPPVTAPPRISIDPRIRQRRIEVLRDQGRRRLRVLGVSLAVAATGLGGWAATISPVLDVDRVRVEGAVRTGAAAVVEAAQIARGEAMVDVDEGQAKAGVESLPWVERAMVRREWPGTVVVRIDERRPAAVARVDAGRWAVLDPQGTVVEVRPDRPGGLVEVEGTPGAPTDLRPGSRPGEFTGPLAVAQALPASLAARTAVVTVIEGGEIALKLNPRGTVRFGSADQAAAKVRAIETVVVSVDSSNLSVLDVRVPASPVLTRG